MPGSNERIRLYEFREDARLMNSALIPLTEEIHVSLNHAEYTGRMMPTLKIGLSPVIADLAMGRVSSAKPVRLQTQR